MKGSLLVYLLQFFSGVIIVAIILMSSTIISHRIFQKNWINSKLQSEVLSSILSSLSSSSLDYNVAIKVGGECNVSTYGGNLISRIGNDEYATRILVPEYVKLKESSSFCKDGLLHVYKKGDEIWLE
jgi:hypothetical protein